MAEGESWLRRSNDRERPVAEVLTRLRESHGWGSVTAGRISWLRRRRGWREQAAPGPKEKAYWTSCARGWVLRTTLTTAAGTGRNGHSAPAPRFPPPQPRRVRRLFPPARRRRGRGGRGGAAGLVSRSSGADRGRPSTTSSPPRSPPASRRRRVRGAALCVCPQLAWPRLPTSLPPSIGSAAPSAPSVPPLLLPGQPGLRLQVFFPRILEAPNMFSAVRAQRHQVRRAGAGQGPCGRAFFGAGQRAEAAARAGAPRSGNRSPCGPAALLLLVRGPFSLAAELPAWPEGREAAPSVPGERAGPGGRGMRCSPGREFPASPRVRGQGQALPLPAPRCSRGEASS